VAKIVGCGASLDFWRTVHHTLNADSDMGISEEFAVLDRLIVLLQSILKLWESHALARNQDALLERRLWGLLWILIHLSIV
jgi:hypothetical protein